MLYGISMRHCGRSNGGGLYIQCHSTVVMSVLCRGIPQWILWCCLCFYRDPNYLQPILNPGGYLPQHSGGSTVLLSDKINLAIL